MIKTGLIELLGSQALLSDGAMGTLLHGKGIGFEQCFDELNLTDPGLIQSIHEAYLESGSDIIQSNTFGANHFKLARHGLEDKVAEINRQGVQIARKAIASMENPRDILVAGDVGPLGVRIAPYGRIQPEQARNGFKEQMAALGEAGVDFFLLETFSDIIEIRSAIQAAVDVRNDLGKQLVICASMTFTRDDRTLLGDDPTRVANQLVSTGADVIGVNCSGGPAQLLRLLRSMRMAEPKVHILVQPNAGWPEQVGGRIMYPADAAYFGRYAQAFCEAGASIIGGCCGTTPEHILEMRKALDENPQGCDDLDLPLTFLEEVGEVQEMAQEQSPFARRLKEGKFSIAVEMDPPRGISTHKLVAGASLLADAGADVINVADSPMARMRMSAWAVCEVVKRQVGVDSTLHFPTRGRNLLRVQGDLLAAHALGIRNIFVVMGDPTAIGDYPEAMDDYDLVPSGLIKLIKKGFNIGVDHSGVSIGQPTAFFVGTALNLDSPDPKKEMKNLKRKIRAGADFILTQPLYQPDKGRLFLEKYEKEFGKLETPILTGILPLVSLKHATFLNNEVPGIDIPMEMLTQLEQAGEDASSVGVRSAIDLITDIREWSRGIYIMPQFHRYDLIAEIIEAVKDN
ncbi:bifunctional homocysteine S-methyltransferase/methylenetetrahydrofolate reductase [Chloroflexota bacterium]